MKTNKWLLALLLIVAACEKDDSITTQELSSESVPIVSVVYIQNGHICKTRANSNGTPTLCFKDSNSLTLFKEQLSEMTDEEKQTTINQYGIRTLYNIADDADDELEFIANTATSEEDFRNKYCEYKSKYEDILIGNDIDTTDLSLYVPDEDNVMSYIGNTDKEYVIGDEIYKANLNESLSSSQKYLSQMNNNGTDVSVNAFIDTPKKGKRVYFNSYLRGNRLWVKMFCKKKMWYGWKNDPHRSYYFDTYFGMNFSYLMLGKYGQEIVTSRLPRFVFNRNVKRGFSIILGKVTSGYTLSGEIHTWTDMTSERDAKGKEIIISDKGYSYPKCIEVNSKIVKIQHRL